MIKPQYSEENVQVTSDSLYTDYYFVNESAYIKVSDIQDRGRSVDAEFTIEYPAQTPIYSNIRINLYSRNDRNQLARDLAGKYTDIILDWDIMLDYVVSDIIQTLRQPPDVLNIDEEPDNQAVEYILSPILIKNQPNSIYCPGGLGKTTLADFICVLLTHGIASPIGFLPGTGERINCLVCDYESDAETHRRYISAIEEGLNLEEHRTIPYFSCTKPFFQYVEHIKELIERYHIELIVIDSQMAATAGYPNGMSESQIASEYYNNLRDIGITSLSLDHSTKADMREDNANTTPYGSVVKYNRCRQLFELKMDDSFVDSDHKEFSLLHKKHNLTRKQPPIGFSIDYTNRGDILEKLTFDKCNIADNPELSKKSLTKIQRIINHLREVGTANIKEIAEGIGEPDDSRNIGSLLANKKGIFIRVSEGIYGLQDKNI